MERLGGRFPRTGTGQKAAVQGTARATGRPPEVLAVSVHGPAGVVDLVVPPGATAAEVAAEYAAHARLAGVPRLHRRPGAVLEPGHRLADAGVGPGEVLLAVDAAAPPPAVRAPAVDARDRPAPTRGASLLAGLASAVAAAAAVLAGWAATDQDAPAVAPVLLAAALVGLVPLGRSTVRALAAPALAAAAAYTAAWAPQPERLPVAVGAAALSAAVAAALARALDRRAEEGLRVWLLGGVAVFLVTTTVTVLGLPAQVGWAVLFLGAVLMARFVPALAVDVPDQLLIDLDRLAVTAWSARDHPAGGRHRTVVPVPTVAAVAARGTRLVVASCAAILAVVSLAAPLLLATADLELDRVGARVLVGAGGAALLLAARSYRHPAARALLRVAGLVACGALLAALLPVLRERALLAVSLLAVAVGALLVVAAVATGRGWRSAWWSRRAEVAEALTGAAAVAALLVATGFFRHLWEVTS